jgi:hypothetical protein
MKQSAPGTRAAIAAGSLAVLMILAACARPAAAQEGTPSPPPADSTITEEPRSADPEPAPAAPAAPTPGRSASTAAWRDSLGLVLPLLADVRNNSDLAQDDKVSRALQASAQDRMLKARERSLRWKSQAETQKATIADIGKEIDAAKKEKREADKKGLEAEKKREEQVRDYFLAMERAQQAEGDYHQATVDYALARIAAVELEKQLAERWNATGYGGRLEPGTRDLEKRLLLAVKARDEKMASFASREKTLVDRRLEALNKWPGPDEPVETTSPGAQATE